MSDYAVLLYMLATFVLLGGATLVWHAYHHARNTPHSPAHLLHGHGIRDATGLIHRREEGRTFELTSDESRILLALFPGSNLATPDDTVLYIGRLAGKPSPTLGVYLRVHLRSGTWVIDPTPWAPASRLAEIISQKYDLLTEEACERERSYAQWPMC
jgi:hypothetical protein